MISESEATIELKVPDGRRRANSLVTELMTDLSPPSHLSRLELLRMESCGNIIGESDITLKCCRSDFRLSDIKCQYPIANADLHCLQLIYISVV